MFIYVVLATEFFVNHHFGKSVRTPKESEHIELASVEPNASVSLAEDGKNVTEGSTDDRMMGMSAPKLTSNMRLMVGGLIFSTLTLFIRAIYRTAEVRELFS